MTKPKSKFWWTKPWLYGFWVALSVFALMLITRYGSQIISTSQAAAVDTAGGIGFDAYICSAIGYANGLIGALAGLTIIIAGVTYVTSGGGKDGISTAKSMMLAAITGVVLYAFGSFLLGTCGVGYGGWIGQFFAAPIP